jgi:hypothetical protein
MKEKIIYMLRTCRTLLVLMTVTVLLVVQPPYAMSFPSFPDLLAPPLRSGALFTDIEKKIFHVETFTRYFLESRGILSQHGKNYSFPVFSVIEGAHIWFFADSPHITTVTDADGAEREIIRYKCFYGEDVFTVAVSSIAKGIWEINAVPGNVPDGRRDTGEMTYDGKTVHRGGEFSGKRSAELYSVTRSDDSIRKVEAFLESVGSEILLDILLKFVKEGRVLVSRHMFAVSGGIVLEYSQNADGRARSLFRGLTGLLSEGLSLDEFNELSNVFGMFMEGNVPEKDLRKSTGIIAGLENSFRSTVSNEQGIEFFFPVPAYQDLYDLSEIDINSEKCMEVMNDIEITVIDVRRSELEISNKMAADGLELDISDIPGAQIRFDGHFPGGILPVAVSESDGTVFFNPDFVKAMAFLRDDLRDKGDITVRGPDDMVMELEDEMGNVIDTIPGFYDELYAGNLYWAVLRSVITHQIRGAYRYNNGVFMMETDPAVHQAVRGDRDIEPNLIAMLYFWLKVVPNRKTVDPFHLLRFIEKNTFIADSLDGDSKRALRNNVMDLSNRFSERSDKRFRNINNVEPLRMYELLCSFAGGASREDILDVFKEVDEEIVDKCLSVLEYMGFVQKERSGDDHTYINPGIFNIERGKAKNILKRTILYPFETEHEYYSERRADLFMLLSKKTKDNIITISNSFDRPVHILVDTGWIPSEQKGAIRQVLQQVNRKKGFSVHLCGDGTEMGRKAAGLFNEGVPAGDMVLMSSEDAIRELVQSGELAAIGESSKRRPFYAGIRDEDLNCENYLYILEILQNVLIFRSGSPFFSRVPGLETIIDKDGLMIFVPGAVKMDLGHIIEVYNRQRDILFSA